MEVTELRAAREEIHALRVTKSDLLAACDLVLSEVADSGHVTDETLQTLFDVVAAAKAGIVTIDPGPVFCRACGEDLVDGAGCAVCGERYAEEGDITTFDPSNGCPVCCSGLQCNWLEDGTRTVFFCVMCGWSEAAI